MRNIFQPDASQEIKERLSRLRPDGGRQWGKMNPAQAVAHCCKGMEQALGDVLPPRLLIGRVVGGFTKSRTLGHDAPLRQNSAPLPGFEVLDPRDLTAERQRLNALI